MPVGAASTSERHGAGTQSSRGGGNTGSNRGGGGGRASTGRNNSTNAVGGGPGGGDVGSIGIGGRGNAGGNDLENIVKGVFGPQNEAPSAPNAPAPAGLNQDDILNEFINQFIKPNERYYLEQRGLIDPSAPPGVGDYGNAFDREYNRILKTLPTDWFSADGQKSDMINTLRQAFGNQFGANALDSEQNRQRNQYGAAIRGKGWNNLLDQSFGDTSDDALISSIIDPQYTAAQAIIDNQRKRGTLTDTGYGYAMQNLGTQKQDANTKLQGIGAGERAKLSGGLNDYIGEIMGKASGYKLGQQFDPNAYDTEFNNRLTSAQGSLEGNIRGAAPTNLFDTGTTLANAGNAQGQTSRGGGSSLLDTLASRQRNRSGNRGLGTTGAF